ncbi:hypothetical protein, variant [Aphanomyces invadans]|uniref:Fungal lipase-type domain-containing protein n=1 Tax=Aphanomyces invadans TaxID=157072 RepID=A0A024TQL0_9STRA|nr:hypothetical protein, variant [Aphanomyces invadans]ETV95652.1 hypothetical protein, variant [Aphanomyces invadans]|eukprot:XP_008875845.1 hypothetical protein, variant [Aphanomyces invadans]
MWSLSHRMDCAGRGDRVECRRPDHRVPHPLAQEEEQCQSHHGSRRSRSNSAGSVERAAQVHDQPRAVPHGRSRHCVWTGPSAQDLYGNDEQAVGPISLLRLDRFVLSVDGAPDPAIPNGRVAVPAHPRHHDPAQPIGIPHRVALGDVRATWHPLRVDSRRLLWQLVRGAARPERENHARHFIYGHKVVGCVCESGACRIDQAQSDDGYAPLVYFPWYQDALHPLDLQAQPHTFELTGVFQIKSKFNRLGTVHPIPHLAFIAHHSYIERLTSFVDLGVFLIDVVALLSWICLTRAANFLPERRLMYVMLVVNFLGSFPVLFVAQKLDPTASWQNMYFFMHAWSACASGIWLLCLLFALDMQRKRVFGCRFYLVKLTLGAVVLTAYMLLFYSSYPTQWIQLFNFCLAILAGAIFSGVMVDVRNKLRYESYADSRPQQLTARFLYSVSIAITYVFFFVALFADPVPRVTSYLPKTALLTDTSIQVIVRSATWALLVIFLPPLVVDPNVYYTCAASALPRLTHASHREFELAHLKQAHQSGGHNSTYHLSTLSWQAPQAFCIETACAMYNQAIGVYDEPVLDKATGSYVMATHDHFKQDGLEFVSELFDKGTDTYGWVARGDKRIVVTFRGTQSAANTVTDLKYRFAVPTWECNRDDLNKTRVHVGFWSAYITVQQQLKRVLRDTIKNMGDVQIYFTGHSLGGALATLAAFDIATDATFNLNEEVVMYSFGAPRVGNHEFAKAYKHYVPNAYRVCNDGDAIVGAPKRSVQLAYFVKSLCYKHVGKAVLLSTRAQGVFVIEPNIVEMAFMAEFRYNALAHLGGGYQAMLEKGIKYTMNPKNAADAATGEKAPLLK